MAETLKGKRVAILVANGFEQVELVKPREALDRAGAQTQIISPEESAVKGWNFTEWGQKIKVDIPLNRADPAQFDALHLPGGVVNPDFLRMNPNAVKFVKHFLIGASPWQPFAMRHGL